MSALCDALTALSLTFGVFCQPAPGGSPPLPKDDREVWTVKPPAPERPVQVPPMPPIIIKADAPPAPPPPPIKVEPPNPYRLALEAAFAGRGSGGGGGGLSLIENQLQAESPAMLAGLTPPDGVKSSPPTSQERYISKGETSGLPVDNTRILAADRFIPGIVETGVNTQLNSADGGEIIIQTSRDVYGYHGRNILVPKGSRMICDYEGPDKFGKSRAILECKRILFAGHRAEILQLKSRVGDVQGRGGVSGEVDNRFWEKYGTAFILAGISASIRLGSAALTTAPTSPATGNQQSAVAQTTDRGSQELSQKLGEITASVLEQTVNLAPILTIAQGARVQIRPGQDWYIRKIGEGQ